MNNKTLTGAGLMIFGIVLLAASPMIHAGLTIERVGTVGNIDAIEAAMFARASAPVLPASTYSSTAQEEAILRHRAAREELSQAERQEALDQLAALQAAQSNAEAARLAVIAAESVGIPVTLTIDVLDIKNAPIDAKGLDRRGRMDVPHDRATAGWYAGENEGDAVRPGNLGNSVIAAHVAVGGRDGLFRKLGSIEVGDSVTIGYDDGDELEFIVVGRTMYKKTELPVEALFNVNSGIRVVSLVTCGGSFSRASGTYDSNIVAYMVPADEYEAAPGQYDHEQ